MLAIGCVDINGGAAEFSWAVRDDSGNGSDCLRSQLGVVRLCWAPSTGPEPGVLECAADRSAEFSCEDRSGVTGFEIEPGPTALWVDIFCSPTSAVGAASPPPADTYEVPAPIVRDVRDGEVATLNSLLIVTSVGTTVECASKTCTCGPTL